MAMMILWTMMAVATADSVPADTAVPANVETTESEATKSPKKIETIVKPPDLTKDKVETLFVNASNDLAAGEIESALSNMTDTIRITTADGTTYNGKKAVRKALNTALAGSLKSISSKPKIDELRSFENGAIVFGSSKDTLTDAVKNPLVLDSIWSATIVLSDGNAKIDTLHHSMNIHRNAIIKEERETFTYVAAAVAGGAAILGFVLGWGL